MTSHTGLSRFVVRHRGWLALAWAIAATVLLPAAAGVGDVLEVGAKVGGSESAAVEQLLRGPLASAYARYAVLVVGGLPSPATEPGAALLGTLVDSLSRAPEVSGTFSYLDGADSLFLGPRGNGTFVVVGLKSESAPPDRLIPPLRALTARLSSWLGAEHPGASLRWTGESALNLDLRRASGDDVGRAERRALPVTAGLLLLAFGTVAAALLPVVSGALAIAVSLGVTAFLARVFALSILVQSVVTMLGLALGIDYALLMVSRFREGLAAGRDAKEAAEAATHHAGHTILLSAGAVAVGFIALLIVPLNEVRAIAVGGLLVVCTSALLATTLLPGILATCGARVDWGRVPRHTAGLVSIDQWRRLGRWVTAHPWWSLAAGGLPLLLLSAQATRLQTGLPRGDWLPPAMESARALRELRAMGRGGVVDGIRIVVELPDGYSVRRSNGWWALTEFTDSLESDRRVERVRSIIGVARANGMGRSALTFLPDSVKRGMVSADGRLALVELLPRDTVTPGGLLALVRELRLSGGKSTGVPGARVLVGGLPAFNADYHDAVAGRFADIALLVVVGTLAALAIGFRSILLPIKAVVLNMLSVTAAFGALTLVFQDGRGGWLFAVSEPMGAVFSSLPVVVFCMVFGLSMDYEVFLITRVAESRRAGLTDREAIIEGMGTTGPVISSAAAIMLAVFAAFTLGGFLLIKMLGFALAVAVLLDATVVRMVVGPALLQLAGRWNWWPGSMSDPAATRVESPAFRSGFPPTMSRRQD